MQSEENVADWNTIAQSVDDYERKARKHLSQQLIDYIYTGTETEYTLKRNVSAYSRYVLRRRVLQDIGKVDLSQSYFDGRIRSELPFFPGPVNLSPLYQESLLDEIRISERYSVPIFVSHFSVVEPLELSKLPQLVSKKTESSLIWQIYVQSNDYDLIMNQVRQAESWGYKAITITVDSELNIKLGNEVPVDLSPRKFIRITPKEVKKLRRGTSLPLIVKGVMTKEDADLAIESGADGVVISNHGGRTLDRGEATLDVLPEIARHLRGSKKTRRTEIFFDGGIRRGTDVLIALALGAKGCLLGRAIIWALAADRANGATRVMEILEGELERAAGLCGVSRISSVKPSITKLAE